MNIRILDSKLNYCGHVSQFTSLQYKRCLYDVGQFELHTGKFAHATELEPGRLLYIDNFHCGIIRKVIWSRNKSGIDIAITGTELKGIASMRVTLPNEVGDSDHFGWDRYPIADLPDMPAESVMKYYADRHMASRGTREFPNLSIAPNWERGIKMRWSTRFETLDAVFSGIGKFSSMGYDIRIDLQYNRYIFDVIIGKNRTIGSSTPVVFSAGFANIDSILYTLDDSKVINAAYAGGVGEDENRTIVTVDNQNAQGFERFESFIDCGSIELPDDIIFEAKNKLKNNSSKETLTGNIFNSTFQYLTHWDIGDTVTLADGEMGVEADKLITAVQENWEGGSYQIIATFGDKENTLLDEIRKKEVIR